MDALSQALQAMRATSAIFFQVECLAPWGFAVPDMSDPPARGPLGGKRLVNFHFVLQGRALVRFADGNELQAEAGDIVVIPFGLAHTVSDGEPSEIVAGDAALAQALSGRPAKIRLGGNGEATSIICGFISCDRVADRLFLHGLPQSLRVGLRDEAGDAWLAGTICHLVSEAEGERPGASVLLSRLAETLFIEALRRYAQQLPAEGQSWLAGACDPLVGTALAHIHASPGHDWKLEELARATGTSRSVLSRRFAKRIGKSPIQYLRHWRLLLAAERLRSTRDALAHIAADAGYRSEAAFNRAFGGVFGQPPARYRNMSRPR